MSRGFGAMQHTMLKTMEAAMRYEWHKGTLAPPYARAGSTTTLSDNCKSRISTQLFGNAAPTRAISDKTDYRHRCWRMCPLVDFFPIDVSNDRSP